MPTPNVAELNTYYQTFSHQASQGRWQEIASYPGCVCILPKSNNDVPDPELPDYLKDDEILKYLQSYDMSVETDYVVSRGLVYMNTQD